MKGEKIKTGDMFKNFLSHKYSENQGIDVDMFKQIIRSIKVLNEDDIIRGKTDKAQYIINGYKLRGINC